MHLQINMGLDTVRESGIIDRPLSLQECNQELHLKEQETALNIITV